MDCKLELELKNFTRRRVGSTGPNNGQFFWWDKHARGINPIGVALLPWTKPLGGL